MCTPYYLTDEYIALGDKLRDLKEEQQKAEELVEQAEDKLDFIKGEVYYVFAEMTRIQYKAEGRAH